MIGQEPPTSDHNISSTSVRVMLLVMLTRLLTVPDAESTEQVECCRPDRNYLMMQQMFLT